MISIEALVRQALIYVKADVISVEEALTDVATTRHLHQVFLQRRGTMSAIVHALATLARASYDIEEINEGTRKHWREAVNSANAEYKQLIRILNDFRAFEMERQIKELKVQNNKLRAWQAAHAPICSGGDNSARIEEEQRGTCIKCCLHNK